MMNRKIILCLFLILIVFNLNAQSNPLSDTAAVNIEAVFFEEIELDGGQFISVSPDGKYFAVTTGQEIQIIEQATMRVVLETSPELRSFDYDSFEWSPDSKKASVTENFFRYMHDSDLWVLDIEASEVYHLFPDDVRDAFYADESLKAYAEYTPVWSPDSKSILLSRTEYNEKETITGIVPDYTESLFKEIEELHNECPYILWTGVFFRENYIYFTWDASESNYSDDGIYRIMPDGSNFEKIAGYDNEMGELLLIDVGSDEKYALAEYVWYQQMCMASSESAEYFYRLIDLSDFSMKVFNNVKTDEDPSITKWALFSPAGNKILSVNIGMGFVYSFMLRNTDGDTDYEIISSDGNNSFAFGSSMLRLKPPVFWTSDDYLYFIASNGDTLFKYRLIEK